MHHFATFTYIHTTLEFLHLNYCKTFANTAGWGLTSPWFIAEDVSADLRHELLHERTPPLSSELHSFYFEYSHLNIRCADCDLLWLFLSPRVKHMHVTFRQYITHPDLKIQTAQDPSQYLTIWIID